MRSRLTFSLPLSLFLASTNAVLAQTNLPGVAARTKAGSVAPAGKAANLDYWLKEAQRTNATQAVYEQAIQLSDTEVAAAAEYNLLHIPLAGTNGPAIAAALHQLETLGDEFTVRWLEVLVRRPEPDLFRAELLATRTRIENRLAEAAPRRPEKLVRERLLRAAVANLTCNPMESPLPRFVMQWAGRHAAEALFRAELKQLATRTLSTRDSFMIAAIRRLAAGRASSLLKEAQTDSK
jgi:hypothetical protein